MGKHSSASHTAEDSLENCKNFVGDMHQQLLKLMEALPVALLGLLHGDLARIISRSWSVIIVHGRILYQVPYFLAQIVFAVWRDSLQYSSER